MPASVHITFFTEDRLLIRLRLVNARIDIKILSIRESNDSRFVHRGGVYVVRDLADFDGYLPLLAPSGTLMILSLDNV